MNEDIIIYVPFFVSRGFIKYTPWCLSSQEGLIDDRGMNCIGYDAILKLTQWSDVAEGSVFITKDIYENESYDEPSAFLMKRVENNWYLTGNTDCPLGIDNGIYDEVYVVDI